MTSTSVTAVGPLHARVAHEGNHVALALEGIIDERCGLELLATKLGSGDLLAIHLGEVRRINSVGVRDWVHWLRDIRSRFKQVLLVEVSPALMHEVAMVRNFFEGCHVMSFQLPVFCPHCEREGVELLETEALLQGVRQLSQPLCRWCGKQAEWEEDESEVRAFLAGEQLASEWTPRAKALVARLEEAPLVVLGTTPVLSQVVASLAPAGPVGEPPKRRDSFWVALIVGLVMAVLLVLLIQLGD